MIPGDIVRLHFYDHTHSHKTVGLLEFEVFGRIEAIDDVCITVRSWDFKDSQKPDAADEGDIDRYNIVRSAIIEAEVLHSEE